MASFPIKYLSLPLDTNYKDAKMWDPMGDRFEQRLAGWKEDLLSKGGLLTLIKSTLVNLPIYYMPLLTIPMSVDKKLKVVQSRFL